MNPSQSARLKKNALWLLLGAMLGLIAFVLIFMIINMLADKPPLSLPFIESPTPTATLTVTSTIAPTSTFASTLTLTPENSPTPLPPEGEAFSIGQSVEGKSLDVYRFGSGPTVRVIIGAIHGGYEGNTATLVFLLRDDLKNGLFKVPDDVTLYLLPVFNPDGFYDFLDRPEGRANAHGVDLNRNWDSYWAADWNRRGCFSYTYLTAGSAPFSEPETQALRDFLLDNHVDALISYHSAMSAIFAGGRPQPDSASDSLARALSTVSFYLYPPVNDPGCEYTGQLIDWASSNGIAAVDVELTDHQSNDILINRKVLDAFLNWKRGE